MTVFKIGLSMLYTLGQPFNTMVLQIPQTNLKYVELVDDGEHSLDKERIAGLKEVTSTCGVKLAVHAPFAGVNIALESEYLLKAMLRRLKQSIANASVLECEMWIFHPGARSAISQFYPGRDWTRNLQSIRQLSRFADDQNVKIGVENLMGSFLLKSITDFQKFYSELNEDIGLVLDTGHANLHGEVDGFIRSFPQRLVHIHAHDNLGQSDQHLGIGRGNINWTSFGELLKKTGFRGVVILESIDHLSESIHRLNELLR